MVMEGGQALRRQTLEGGRGRGYGLGGKAAECNSMVHLGYSGLGKSGGRTIALVCGEPGQTQGVFVTAFKVRRGDVGTQSEGGHEVREECMCGEGKTTVHRRQQGHRAPHGCSGLGAGGRAIRSRGRASSYGGR